jgi:hypothetical protein
VKDGYRIIGAEMSPYSVKVRSYFPVTLGITSERNNCKNKSALDPVLAAAGCLEGLCG